ncbi:MAG: glycosyltransferase family 4 protein [Phycisphaerales bacterium]|nr:glycosyltransferase family 4 protein [Phycisphaerales bacterium]
MTEIPNRGTLLIISQVYVPDPASVGQHMHDAAEEMVHRGYKVVVFTSARGYDDPTQKFPLRETIDGVDVRRMALSSFGKKSIPLRVLAQLIFLLQCAVRGVFVGDLQGVLVSTSPPMASVAALIVRFVRRVPLVYWVMDLNPDQMVELGKLTPDSMLVRLFNVFNRYILKRSKAVVALDRFMAERLNRKLDVTHKLDIMPPWPHDSALEVVPHESNPFRAEYDLGSGVDGKFVVMYSGNHGFSTPVVTVLEAAVRMQDRERLKFFFIGGGVGKKDVRATIEKHHPTNLTDLPYQPFDRIKYSLSAADVHLVSVGDDVVGVVHPCKVYGAMAVARPILLLGPDPCHVSDIIREHKIGWHIRHGDVDGAIRVIDEILATPRDELEAMGRRARELASKEFGMRELRGRFCDVVERAIPGRSSRVAVRAESRP